jgi:hypothetical protein
MNEVAAIFTMAFTFIASLFLTSFLSFLILQAVGDENITPTGNIFVLIFPFGLPTYITIRTHLKSKIRRHAASTSSFQNPKHIIGAAQWPRFQEMIRRE